MFNIVVPSTISIINHPTNYSLKKKEKTKTKTNINNNGKQLFNRNNTSHTIANYKCFILPGWFFFCLLCFVRGIKERNSNR